MPPSATSPANSVNGYAASEVRVRQQAPSSESSSSMDVRVSLSRTEETSASDAPYSPSRIAAIRQAISEGRFTINSSAIADRLINSARELLQGNSQQPGNPRA